MKKCNAPKNQTTRRILLTACATALAVAFTVSLPSQAHAGQVTVPPVPADLEVEPGFKAFLEGHAVGTQNYVCQLSGAGFAFVLFTPQATLFNDPDHQIITHFFSLNPDEGGTIRATWENSRDTSTIWAAVVPDGSATVDPNSIVWLKLSLLGAEE